MYMLRHRDLLLFTKRQGTISILSLSEDWGEAKWVMDSLRADFTIVECERKR